MSEHNLNTIISNYRNVKENYLNELKCIEDKWKNDDNALAAWGENVDILKKIVKPSFLGGYFPHAELDNVLNALFCVLSVRPVEFVKIQDSVEYYSHQKCREKFDGFYRNSQKLNQEDIESLVFGLIDTGDMTIRMPYELHDFLMYISQNPYSEFNINTRKIGVRESIFKHTTVSYYCYRIIPNKSFKINALSSSLYNKLCDDAKRKYEKKLKSQTSVIKASLEENGFLYDPISEAGLINRNYVTSFPEYFNYGKYVSDSINGLSITKRHNLPINSALNLKKENVSQLYAMIIRLMWAVPLGKLQIFVYDPVGLGENFELFNSCFGNEKIFPAKKIMSKSDELKEVIEKEIENIANVRQNYFTVNTPDWSSYNKNNSHNQLPYKLFVLFDLPNDLNDELLQKLSTLIHHSADCGISVLFTDIPKGNNESEHKWAIFKNVLENSEDFENYFTQSHSNNADLLMPLFEDCQIELEEVCDRNFVCSFIEKYIASLEAESHKSAYSFDDVVASDCLYNKSSVDGMKFDIGFDELLGKPATMELGDSVPHYLIGGATGQGKSNLLHNIIMSMCSRYSPSELELYLIDFKQGVEFIRYIRPASLPHAKLVATGADAEYGVSVLDHLIDKMDRRYTAFKEKDCQDYKEYRSTYPDDYLPRNVIIIDEFQELFTGSEKEKTVEKLMLLAKKGRACGIHLMLCTQTITGLEGFGNVQTQFVGRVALRCNPEDSVKILGGVSSNNDAASKLPKYHAILNTEQGNVSANIVFAVAEAIKEKTKTVIEKMVSCSGSKNETIFYDGLSLPIRPGSEAFTSSHTQIMLGNEIKFDNDPVKIRLRNAEDSNMIICGHDDEDYFKHNLFKSIIESVANSKSLDEVIYIGEDDAILDSENDTLTCYESIKSFLRDYSDEAKPANKIFLFDNCNLVRELNYPEYGAPPKGTDANKFDEIVYGPDANNDFSSHTICYFSKYDKLKNSKINLQYFRYRIGYNLRDDDIRSVVGNFSQKAGNTTNRCFLCDDGEITKWFRPYVDKK